MTLLNAGSSCLFHNEEDLFDDSDVHGMQTFLHNNSCGENQVYEESSNLLQITSELSIIPEEDTDVFTFP